MSVYGSSTGIQKPKLVLGNIDGGGKVARGKMRMFRMGQRHLSSYEYDTLDIAQIGGTGGNKHIEVDEIERFFDRGGKGAAGATITDPRMSSGAVVFIPMDEEGRQRYYTRSYTDDVVDSIPGGYRSWGAQNIEQETTGLIFKLTQLQSDKPAYLDNAHFWVSNILWEFSVDGGRGRWYQLYELPNQRVRITLPEQTQQVRLRAVSNNPDEWVQSVAITPRTDFQNKYIANLHWYLPNGGDPEDYIDFDDFGYLVWPEAQGGRGDVIYTIYWTPENEMSDAVLMGRVKGTDLAPGEFALPVHYLGGYLHVFAQDIMSTLHIMMRFTKSIEDCEVLCDPSSAVYTGYVIEPAITVRFKLDLSVLPPEYYSIEYQDNVNVGTATVIVEGLDYYYGTPEDPGHFTITQANVNSCTVILGETSYVYDNTAKKPSVTLMLGSFKVSPNDYDVSYADNVNVGTAHVTITGKGNMTGTRTENYAITARPLDRIALSKQSDVYAETWTLPSVSVYGAGDALLGSESYSYAWSPNEITNAGNYSVTATGKGNYTGTLSATFMLEKADLSNSVFDTIEDQWFTGNEIKPKPTVVRNELARNGNRYDRTLVEGTDFYYSWENNITVGTAYVIITGMGNYLGSDALGGGTWLGIKDYTWRDLLDHIWLAVKQEEVGKASTTFQIVNCIGDGTWLGIKSYTWDEIGELAWGQLGGFEYLP